MRVERRVIVGLVALSLAGCSGDRPDAPPGTLTNVATSWVPGQPSLADSPAFLAVAGRAEKAGDRRHANRVRELELIDARRVAAEERSRREIVERYREIRARALARYREALRIAARKRREMEAQRRRRLAEARRQREKLMEKLEVKPGDECSVPEIREQFDCVSGRLPVGES